MIKLSFNNTRNLLEKAFVNYRIKTEARKLADSLINIEVNNFEDHVSKLLFNIISYAKENVPYYREVMKDIHLNKKMVFSNLMELPLLTKEIIRTQGQAMYSGDFDRVFGYWMNTGGSTGEPLKFPVTTNFEFVHQKCLYILMGGNSKDVIVAVDGSRVSDGLRNTDTLWNTGSENFPYGSVHYSTLYMTDTNLSRYIEHLNEIKPSLIRGYPSGLEKIAKYLLANNIKLQFVLKGIYLTSEYYDNSNAEILRKAFNCPIFGQYGHSEVSVFAFTLANSLEYICSPLYGFTEILDENGNHVKEGESGEIVVTGYSNKVMPFIRYRTGDTAIYGGTINGVVKLKSLQGRTVDFIYNSDNKKVYLIGLVFGGHLKSFERIIRWQIEQDIPGFIEIRIVKDTGFSDFHEKEIVGLFESIGVKPELQYVDDIPLTQRGKRKFLIQKINESLL